jgi:hypothetical protein
MVVLLLGYGTMTGNQLPHAVLSDESIGTEDSLDAVFPSNHCIISVGIGSDRGVVVVDADSEIAAFSVRSNTRSSSTTSAIILFESFSSQICSASDRQALGCGFMGIIHIFP